MCVYMYEIISFSCSSWRPTQNNYYILISTITIKKVVWLIFYTKNVWITHRYSSLVKCELLKHQFAMDSTCLHEQWISCALTDWVLTPNWWQLQTHTGSIKSSFIILIKVRKVVSFFNKPLMVSSLSMIFVLWSAVPKLILYLHVLRNSIIILYYTENKLKKYHK